MLLRKRPRPSMQRTTSMTEFAADVEAPRPPDQGGADRQGHHLHLLQQQRNQRRAAEVVVPAAHRRGGGGPVGADLLQTRCQMGSMAPPGGGSGRRRKSREFPAVETVPFLMACGLCKRRLGPGLDTFMYRGDIAFCSLECRQQHMNQDERKDKCSLTSMKDTPRASNCSEKSDSSETVAAA